MTSILFADEPNFNRKRFLIFFALYMVIGAICSIRVPVMMSGVDTKDRQPRAYWDQTSEYAWRVFARRDIFDQVQTPPATTVALNESEYESIWFDVRRYEHRMGSLFLVMAGLWFGIIPHYFKVKELAWLFPLGLYIAVAIWRLLYVPCIWTVTSRYYARPAVFDAETRALWDVGTAHVRYGLVLFEELVLLVIVALCYGLLFAVFRQLDPRKKSVSR
jgi:hypothetical protein